jgi:hypothetical protein
LQNSSGLTFGSGGNYPFYVQIVVGGPGSAPPRVLAIDGVVWDDECRLLENGSPSGGCVLDGATEAYRADGRLADGERGLAGVQVRLSVGACPGNNFVFTSTTTDATGAYHFADLQPGPHCLTIDPSTEPNASLLLPGEWTSPAPATGSTTVIVDSNQNQPVDFGWDYQ